MNIYLNDCTVNTSDTNTSYPSKSHERLIQYFGNLEAAKLRGYALNEKHDILIDIFKKDGSLYTYTPKNIQANIKRLSKNRTYQPIGDAADNLHKQINSIPYQVIRLLNPIGGAKYLMPSKDDTCGLFVSYRPTIDLVQKFNKEEKIYTLYLFEGAFKSDLANIHGLMSASYSGISTFKLTDDLKDTILRCGIDKIILCYDGDCRDLNKNPFQPDKSANNRPRNFYLSAAKFAKELHEWLDTINHKKDKKERTKIKLLFCCPQKEQQKALDDMLLEAPEKKDEIIDAIKEEKTNDYFIFFTLPKTQYEKRLLQFYHLDSPRNFYKFHKDTLQDKQFTFKHTKFSSNVYKFCKLRNTLVTIRNPFDVPITPHKIYNCKKYIGETEKQKDHIFNLFDHLNKIYLSLPTGGGKTTLSTKYAYHFIDSNKRGNVYIVVPTKTLGKQLARDIKKKFIFEKEKDYTGKTDIHKTKYDKRIIVVTYDSLKKVAPSKYDLLIIDEAHNIVNQSTFRELRYMYNMTKVVKKVLCLSATPNKAFIKFEDYKLIQANIKYQNKITFIPYLLTDDSILEAITNELLVTDFNKKDFIQQDNLFNKKEKHKIHFVFINNVEHLFTIKNTLIKKGLLKSEEIEILYSNNTSDTYTDIVDKQTISDKVKLVLVTCLISEGVNIKNKNIGKVLIGGVKCIDTLRQFPARFRHVKNTFVQLYLKENSTNHDYFLNTVTNIEDALILADSHVKILEKNLNECKEDSFNHENDMRYFSKHYDFAYVDVNKEIKKDMLKIYSNEYKRKINTIPVQDILSELSEVANIEIAEEKEVQEISQEIKEELKTLEEKHKEEEAKKEIRILNALNENEKITLVALKEYAIEDKKYKLIPEIEEHIKGEITAKEREQIEDYKNNNEDIRELSLYSKIVKQYVSLKEHITNPSLALSKFTSKNQYKDSIKSLDNLKSIEDYKNANTRKRKMSSTERADAKALIHIQKEVLKKFENETFSLSQLLSFFKDIHSKLIINNKGELKKIQKRYTESYAMTLLKSLFNFEKISSTIFTNISLKNYENFKGKLVI